MIHIKKLAVLSFSVLTVVCFTNVNAQEETSTSETATTPPPPPPPPASNQPNLVGPTGVTGTIRRSDRRQDRRLEEDLEDLADRPRARR